MNREDASRLERLVRWAEIDDDGRVHDCFAKLPPEAPVDYRALASVLACVWQDRSPRRVGIAGGQGAGKSTLGALVETACAAVGIRTCVLSLDDFYLSRQERETLSRRLHPLFETRGPPGTHDMDLCIRHIEALAESGAVEVPVFDKARDERTEMRRLQGPFDLVVLEGWCVGATAVEESELEDPFNSLEASHDPDGTWRRAVNRALRESYEPVWSILDSLVFLDVPSLGAVRRWRTDQEQDRSPELRMAPAEVEAFVQFFERITVRLKGDLEDRADWVVHLGEDHDIDDLRRHRSQG